MTRLVIAVLLLAILATGLACDKAKDDKTENGPGPAPNEGGPGEPGPTGPGSPEGPPSEPPAEPPALSTGSDRYDALAGEMIGKMEELADVLDECQTADDLKARKAELEEIGGAVKALAEKAEGMEEPSPERERELESKYGDRMKATMGRIMKVAMRFSEDPETAELLGEVMGGMK